MTAARTDVDATVGYYGVGIDELLRESHAIATPADAPYPDRGRLRRQGYAEAMHEGLDDHPKVTLHDYEGMDHGFATQFGKRRDGNAQQLADKRTTEFFGKHLA